MTTPESTDPISTQSAVTRKRYDRIAPIYDAMESLLEFRIAHWRRDLWARAGDGRILELGVGTGKNIKYYPPGAKITGIDISPKMLDRAERRATRLGRSVELLQADAQALPFETGSFDMVVATFVFCSVPDPVLGLKEARRVLAPDGTLLLLEHVLSRKAVLGTLMNWMNPITVWLTGANINRDTIANVKLAGFSGIESHSLSLDVVKSIKARNLSSTGNTDTVGPIPDLASQA